MPCRITHTTNNGETSAMSDAHSSNLSLIEQQVQSLGNAYNLKHATNSKRAILREFFEDLCVSGSDEGGRLGVDRRYPMPAKQYGNMLRDGVSLRVRASNRLSHLRLFKLRDGSYRDRNGHPANGLEPGNPARACLKLCETNLGSTDPHTASCLEQMAWMHFQEARRVANDLRSEVGDQLYELLVQGSSGTGDSAALVDVKAAKRLAKLPDSVRGRYAYMQEHLDKAEEGFVRAQAAVETSLGADHPQALAVNQALAEFYLFLAQQRGTGGTGGQDGGAQNGQSAGQDGQDRDYAEDASVIFEHTYTTREVVHGRDHVLTVRSILGLARARAQQLAQEYTRLKRAEAERKRQAALGMQMDSTGVSTHAFTPLGLDSGTKAIANAVIDNELDTDTRRRLARDAVIELLEKAAKTCDEMMMDTKTGAKLEQWRTSTALLRLAHEVASELKMQSEMRQREDLERFRKEQKRKKTAPLPPEWEELKDHDGVQYWWNSDTGETTYTRPDGTCGEKPVG